MEKLFGLLLLMILFISCKKNNDTQTKDPFPEAGVYKGTFNRSGMDTVNITLNISESNFDGHSETRHYPAICRGSFSRDQQSIIFQDSCAWPANFDWSLILNGRYEFSGDDKNIRMWRDNGASIDEYVLTRLTR